MSYHIFARTRLLPWRTVLERGQNTERRQRFQGAVDRQLSGSTHAWRSGVLTQTRISTGVDQLMRAFSQLPS